MHICDHSFGVNILSVFPAVQEMAYKKKLAVYHYVSQCLVYVANSDWRMSKMFEFSGAFWEGCLWVCWVTIISLIQTAYLPPSSNCKSWGSINTCRCKSES